MAKWQNSAACRTAPDDELWFPDSYTSPAGLAAVEEAKSICAWCPVRPTCLREAIANEGARSADGRSGIRGGMTPSERVAEHRRLVRLARKLVAA
jgi:hypothetical protein